MGGAKNNHIIKNMIFFDAMVAAVSNVSIFTVLSIFAVLTVVVGSNPTEFGLFNNNKVIRLHGGS